MALAFQRGRLAGKRQISVAGSTVTFRLPLNTRRLTESD
ncbi:hypothetical protein P262_02505 [Cronobacter malonaticus]|uniref:Uncharacterized protein n=1 Tax=Cronobacter malonaticus TaxID=413503 RepID=V5TY04_9ENTR|nr:hypothetical protein P262_02505 [Cronobacter malonaticus]CCJ98463.1 hypothetical protein BN130_1037 [Cronobacter malonaticus 507]